MSEKISFKNTLNLPRTDFSIRSNPKKEDPELIERWEREDLFEKTFYLNKGNEVFILHDGPPYANGNIHLGHAYNKILKDIVTKAQRMLGKQVPVTPGWDCHGLPIELKVTKEKPDLSRTALKNACREYAQKWVNIQREEFKKLGVLMNWAHPYLTMHFGYEASVLRAFGILVSQGNIERAKKTVPWCYSCQTVLATAEIEYQERKDPSIYLLFPLEQKTSHRLFSSLQDKTISFSVWTTTPWTLPLNRALLLKPKAEYVVLSIKDHYVIVGKELADQLCNLLNVKKEIVEELKAEDFIKQNAQAQHPFIENLFVPILLDDSVELSEGTACVHSAPGAGPQDYEVGIKYNLDIYSPIDPSGNYTDEVEPKELVGRAIVDGQGQIIKKLADSGKLLHKTSIRHSYPHCWRCRKGLIFRATKQWFCNLSKRELKEKTLKAVETINMFPAVSKNRFKETLKGRLEWCLSRQRVWGIPIPALICQDCDYNYTSQELIEHVAKHVEQTGIEWWDAVPVAEIIPKKLTCPSCNVCNFKKEQDILDVWFDSGVSHFAVLVDNPPLQFPANIYLEGKDQHRGWFQSSLLTSMAIEETSCMKSMLTHGFAVDAKGHKMSKSLGNVVSPDEIINKIGTDGLRLWASSIDYRGEAVVSDVLLKNVQEVLRKVRNTCRFLLSNLYDFTIEEDAIDIKKLLIIDKYAMQELCIVNYDIIHAYLTYDFTAVFHQLSNYCTVNLSSFYLAIIKDRLYVEQPDGHARRSAQTACWYILDTLTRLIAPILSFTAERISDHYQKDKVDSIHLQQFSDLAIVWEVFPSNESYARVKSLLKQKQPLTIVAQEMENIKKHGVTTGKESSWQLAKKIRSALLKAIEIKREQGIIKDSLEAQLILYFDQKKPFFQLLSSLFKGIDQTINNQSIEKFFKELLLISQCKIAYNPDELDKTEFEGLYAMVKKAAGAKCPRCWQWDRTDHPDMLCDRCQKIIK